jgi:hypothetical protein
MLIFLVNLYSPKANIRSHLPTHNAEDHKMYYYYDYFYYYYCYFYYLVC